MRRSSRLLGESSNEVSWIATTDMFVVGCCFLFFLTLAAQRRSAEVEDQLVEKNAELELIKSVEKDTDQQPNDVDIALRDQKVLYAKLKVAEDELSRIFEQRLRDARASLEKSEALSATVVQLENSLKVARSETGNLALQLDAAAREALRIREYDLSQQRRVNNKLVGLGGKLENVVFLVDISRSMRNAKGSDGKIINNWGPTVETIERWINGLDVTSAALILFGDTAEIVIQMQSLNEGGREKILNALKLVDPIADGTNFLAAFEKAYEIPSLDTIIVFSDGLPSVDVEGKRIFVGGRSIGESDEEYKLRFSNVVAENVSRVLAVHRRISEMAKQHPDVAVNVIGLGSGVYNEKTGNLLNDLALNNGGVFLALPSRNSLNDNAAEK